jgi:hypothetical protein
MREPSKSNNICTIAGNIYPCINALLVGSNLLCGWNLIRWNFEQMEITPLFEVGQIHARQ